MTCPCSCGETKVHDVAHRRTYDERGVILWSDGDLTFAFSGIPGVGKLRDVERARRIGWLVIDEVCIFTAAELPLLVKTARALPAGALPGDLRRAFREASAPSWRLPGGWTVESADPHGRVLRRVWYFPRLSGFSDLAILHERGSYTVLRRVIGAAPNGLRPTRREDNVFADTGFTARNLRDAFAAVRTIAPQPARAGG